MKKIVLLTALLMATFQIFAQPWLDVMNTKADVDLNTTRSVFANYWQGRNEEKGTGIKPFKRWEWFWEQRQSANQVLPKRSIAWEEWNRYRNSAAFRTANTQNAAWSFVGPATTASGYNGIGRLNSIAFHPTDVNTFYVGAPAGGLWKTTNGGTTWTVLTDHLPVIGVSDIAIDPSNPNTIYILTGDCDGGDTYSIGLLKSTDAGVTWNTTGMSWTVTSFKLLKRIQINPSNPQMLWIAASDGIWRSVNGGSSFTQVQTGSFVDIELHPADPNILYAASYSSNSGLYRSTNAGGSFSLVTTITGGRRVNLAVTAHNPQIVQVLACNSSGGLHSLWKSSDAGQSYTQYFTGSINNNMLNSSSTGTGSTSGQGTYDLAFNINPADSNNIWLGGVNTWVSDNGGATWSIKSIWSGGAGPGIPVVHADKHFQVFHPVTNVLYECNDGGLYRTSNNGVTWTDLSAGLGISQIYRIGISTVPGNQALIGLQDNSTKEYKNSLWFERRSTGDGFESIYDQTDAAVMYVSSYYGNISRSTNGGSSWTTIAQSTGTGVHSQGPWLTPYILNPLRNNTLLIAKREVYRSYDRGTTWTPLTAFGTSTTATAIAYAPSDTSTIYAAFGSRLNKSTDDGATWSVVTSAFGTISYIAVHPTNPQRLWITLPSYSTNKVMTSSDGGLTWTALNSGLPNLPVNCIVYQNGSNDGLYIGTDVGVYYRNNTMTDWIPFQTGLPNTIVNELEISYSDSKIWAGTYGRGLWTSPLYSGAPCTIPTAPTGGSTQTVCAGVSVNFTANVTAGNTVDWYAAASGGVAILTGNNVYTTSTPGTYYAEARNLTGNCVSISRTAFMLNATQLPSAPTGGGTQTVCAGTSVSLIANVPGGITVDWFATATGGTPLLTGNNVYSTSTAGTYYAEARNSTGNCISATRTAFTVNTTTQPAVPTGGGTQTVCAGTSVSLTANVPAGITVDWFATATGGTSILTGNNIYTTSTAGTYYAQARNPAGNCISATRTAFTVNTTTPPAVPTGGGTQTVCAGTSVSLTANVSAGITVDWFTTATGGAPILTGNTVYTTSTPGTYYAESRNPAGNCVSSMRTAFTINNTAALPAPSIIPAGPSSICSGASLNLQSSVTSGNQWYKDGAVITGATSQTYSVTVGGSYTVTATSGGCTSPASATVSVTVNAVPAQPTISVNGAQLTSSATAGNQWYLNGTAIAGATGQVYNATSNGTYTLIVTVNGCSSTSSAPYVHTTTGITSPSLDKQMVIAPNPVRNKLEVVYTGPAATFSIELIDMKGRIIKTGERFNSRFVMNMAAFASGNYVVRIVNTRTKEQVLKIIIKQ